MRYKDSLLLSLAVATAFFGLPALAADTGAGAEDYERFYLMEIGRHRAGWLVERQTLSDEQLVTETETRMELSRAGTATAVEMYSRFVETLDHRPVAGTTRQTLSAVPLETSFRFEEGEVVVQEAGGATRRKPLGKESWMTPVAAGERVTRQVQRAYALAADGARAQDSGSESAFEVRRLELLTGLEPVTSRLVLQAIDDPVIIDGEPRAAGRWTISESYAPMITTDVWFDHDGVLLRTEAQMMGTTMVMTLTADDPRLGIRSASGAGEPQESELSELLIQNFIHPDRPLDAPRNLRRAVYRLHVDGIDLAPMVPSRGVQTAHPDGDGVRVLVDLETPAKSTVLAKPGEFLEPSRYVDYESAAVQNLLEPWRKDLPQAGSALDPVAQAESLRRLVAGHLGDKNLGTVLGTASEAATSGAGDCTEHAVLLAAVLRAQAIPSRIAVGLVYAEHFAGERDLFAYHMWTQAHLGDEKEGHWVDLDATLPRGTPFDASHILFATSSLSGEGVPLIGTGVEALFGLLSIEILDP